MQDRTLHFEFLTKAKPNLKNHQTQNFIIPGVRFNVVFCSIGLKSAIFTQNWHNMAHFEENTPPFVILSQKIENYF